MLTIYVYGSVNLKYVGSAGLPVVDSCSRARWYLVQDSRIPLWLLASGSASIITSILYFQEVAGGPTMDTSLHTHYELSTSNSPETSDYQM